MLATDSLEQAIERAGSKAGNHGAQAASAVLETIRVLEQL
jgi:6,7-dimethyl-8-ribityllumazine synthase